LREGCAVQACVLKTGHVHLLVTPAACGQVARMMQSMGAALCALHQWSLSPYWHAVGRYVSPGTNVAERCSAYRTHVEQAITRDELNSIRLHIQRIPTGRSASARPSKRNYRVAPVPPRSAGQGSLHPLRKVRTAPCFA